MSFIRPILLAVMTVAFATYAFDCLAMSTPAAATQCCDSMPCSSHGHKHSQECCKSMPSMHAPFVQTASAHALTFSPVFVAVLLGFSASQVLVSLSGDIPLTARPTFSHEGDFNFTWGFRRDFDLTVLVPVVTNHFEMPNTNGNPLSGGTGLGDARVLVKYRFHRRDSKRGTTQASVTLGSKLPTGRTNLAARSGKRLPASLQPGSGSSDFFVAANWTYTGLFHLRRLVADEDFHSLLRAPGTQKSHLGSDVESRFWISYRPYESKNGAREWFIGPVLTWVR